MKKILLMMTCLGLFKGIAAQDICITELEREVYGLINQHRQEKGLPEVPLTRTLMITANSNVFELSKKSMIVQKPSAFGNYTSNTGQIRTSFSMTEAARIFASLIRPGATSHYKVIGNLEEYSHYNWKAMGICIRNTGDTYTPTSVYIIFGDGTDEVVEPVTCETELYYELIPNVQVKKPSCPILKFRAPENTGLKVFMYYIDKTGKRKKLPDTPTQAYFETVKQGQVASLYLQAPDVASYEVYVSEYIDPIVMQEDILVKIDPTQKDTIWKNFTFQGNTVEEISAYLDKGGKLETPDDRGWTMLHRAVERNHVEAVKFLLAKGSNVNQLTTAKEVPLDFASTEEMYDVLMEKKPLLKLVNMDKGVLLHSFTRNGLIKAVRYMVENEKADINVTDRKNGTPMYYAVDHGHLEVVKYLLDKGAKSVQGWGDYPIYAAVKDNNLQMAELLFSYSEAKKQVNLVNEDGSYPIVYAVTFGTLDMVKLLVKNGADIKVKNTNPYSISRNKTLLQICEGRQELQEIRNYLLSVGAK